MRQEIDTIIFDLDGTIYQNTEFHRDYLRFLVDGTGLEAWADSLIAFADAVFVGERLVMNAFTMPARSRPPRQRRILRRWSARCCRS